jgi:hypothetical protein
LGKRATLRFDRLEAFTPWDLLRFFFIFSSLQPVVQKYMLAQTRRRTLAKIAQKRDATVITLIHRQKTVSLLGIPLARYIDIDDSQSRFARYAKPVQEIDRDHLAHAGRPGAGGEPDRPCACPPRWPDRRRRPALRDERWLLPDDGRRASAQDELLNLPGCGLR